MLQNCVKQVEGLQFLSALQPIKIILSVRPSVITVSSLSASILGVSFVSLSSKFGLYTVRGSELTAKTVVHFMYSVSNIRLELMESSAREVFFGLGSREKSGGASEGKRRKHG